MICRRERVSRGLHPWGRLQLGSAITPPEKYIPNFFPPPSPGAGDISMGIGFQNNLVGYVSKKTC